MKKKDIFESLITFHVIIFWCNTCTNAPCSVGELVARTTIRVLGVPQGALPPDWQGEDVSSSALRAVNEMHLITVPARYVMLLSSFREALLSA